MSQPFTFQAVNNRSPLRIGQITFTVLALLAFALGSVLLSLVWFGVGVASNGKDFYADTEAPLSSRKRGQNTRRGKQGTL